VTTIAAISTPPGSGGIAIIRLSGPAAHTLARRVFRPWPAAPRYFHLYLGYIHEPDSGSRLDQVFLALMPENRSYTREAMAEIHCHGGEYVTRRILNLLFALGAEPAAAGEFTRRAYLNGRLDLAQAEAVAGLIAAESEAGLKAAASQLAGGLSDHLAELLAGLEKVLAGVEVAIDLLAEEGGNYRPANLMVELAGLAGAGQRLCDSYRRGRFLQAGLKVVLAGRPNVGKSSILNALLAEDRALVSTVAGTTRDVVSAFVEIAGVRIELSDTAGLDTPRDELEALGMARTEKWLEQADLVLLVLDASRPLADRDLELYRRLQDRPRRLVLNKQDLGCRLAEEEIRKRFGYAGPLLKCIGLREEPEIDEVVTGIAGFIESRRPEEDAAPLITRQRHYELLSDFVAAVERARELAAAGPEPPLDLLADELHQARRALLQITGAENEAAESLLDKVFNGFCVGK
jgi:tRNA modification GTPase